MYSKLGEAMDDELKYAQIASDCFDFLLKAYKDFIKKNYNHINEFNYSQFSDFMSMINILFLNFTLTTIGECKDTEEEYLMAKKKIAINLKSVFEGNFNKDEKSSDTYEQIHVKKKGNS